MFLNRLKINKYNKIQFPGISILRIICNVITFQNIQIFFSQYLTDKSYPEFGQLSTMGCVIKNSVTHILRSDCKNE